MATTKRKATKHTHKARLDPDTCPECKLLLNSLGLVGIVKGYGKTRRMLNRAGKDFSPSLIERLASEICKAHVTILAFEAEVMSKKNHVSMGR